MLNSIPQVMSQGKCWIYLYTANGQRDCFVKRGGEGERTRRVKNMTTDSKIKRVVYLFLDCLYVKRLRVLRQQVSIIFKQDYRCGWRSCGDIRNVFAEFAADHLLGDLDFHVGLAVVDSEAQADEVGQDGSCALLRADRRSVWRRGKGTRERKTVQQKSLALHLRVWLCCPFEVARTGGRMELRMAGFHVRDDVRAWMNVLAAIFFSIDGMQSWGIAAGSHLSRPIGPAGLVWETLWRAIDQALNPEKLKRRPPA